MSDPVIKIDGVAVYIDKIIRMEKRYRLENGGTTRVEIGTTVYMEDGSVLTCRTKMADIEALMAKHTYRKALD